MQAQAPVAALTAKAAKLADLKAEEGRPKGLEDAAEAEKDAAPGNELSGVTPRVATAKASLATVTAERTNLRPDAVAFAVVDTAEGMAGAVDLAEALAREVQPSDQPILHSC